MIESLKNPKILENLARGKVYYEPFMGGGTGVIEAAIMGYDSIGVDVNPVAVRIARATRDLLKKEISGEYMELIGKKVLDLTEKKLEETGWEWNIDGKIVSYVFITRNKVPSWIDKYGKDGKTVKVLRCPHCGTIFESTGDSKEETCPRCGKTFQITYHPKFELGGKYPEEGKYKVWAVELRALDGKRWRKLVVDAREVSKWLEDSKKRAEEKAKIAREILDENPLEKLLEGRRLKREGIEKFSELYSTRQLATFVAFAEASSELGRKLKLNGSLMEVLSIVLSESAKSASLVAKWHPPIGEPVPAGAMKTYWVPEYTVETNPLARIPKSIRPLARNSLASSLSRAVRIARSEVSISDGVQFNASVSNSTTFIPPVGVDLAVVDPPYMDTVKSYASLSIVHYGAMKVFDEVAGTRNGTDLSKVEKSEIPRDRKSFGKAMGRVFSNIARVLNKDGRVVLFYNRKSPLDWENVLRAAVENGLYPRIAYWVVGEPPGGLARSRLKGVFIVVMTKEMPEKVEIIFNEPLERAESLVSIDSEIEMLAMNALKGALESVYDNKGIVRIV